MGEEEEFQFRLRLERERAGKPPAAQLPQAPASEKESPRSFLNLAGAAIEPNLTLLSGAVAAPISGYAGMLGGMLPGPPGQAADWTRATQAALTYMPQTEGGRNATSVISYPFEKYGQATDFLGGKTAEVTGSPAAGAAVKTAADVGGPLALARLLRMAPAAETAQGQAAQWLMRKAVKPSTTLPTQQTRRAMLTMLDEGVNPTMGGMDKGRGLVHEIHPQVQSTIANSAETVNIPTAGSALRNTWSKARRQSGADMEAVRGVWDDFRNLPDVRGNVDIPVQLANELKRGQQTIASEGYGQLASSAIEARKDLARGLREQIAAKVPEVVAPLRREADLMNMLEVADPRVRAQANNNPLGLTALSGSKAGAAAFAFDRSALAKGLLARALYGLGDPRAAQATIGAGAAARTQELER